MAPAFRVLRAAGQGVDEIFVHTRDTWGDEQAERHVRGLFAKFEDVAARRAPWRQIPAEFGIDGYFCRYERRFIYWRVLEDGSVGIATVLHERMHQLDRFREDTT